MEGLIMPSTPVEKLLPEEARQRVVGGEFITSLPKRNMTGASACIGECPWTVLMYKETTVKIKLPLLSMAKKTRWNKTKNQNTK